MKQNKENKLKQKMAKRVTITSKYKMHISEDAIKQKVNVPTEDLNADIEVLAQ